EHGRFAGRKAAAGIEPGDQRRGRRAELLAVVATGVEAVPELRRAYGRANDAQSSPSKSGMAASAPTAHSSASVWAVVTPMARMPARRAASTPTKESSNTRQALGGAPRRRAASR